MRMIPELAFLQVAVNRKPTLAPSREFQNIGNKKPVSRHQSLAIEIDGSVLRFSIVRLQKCKPVHETLVSVVSRSWFRTYVEEQLLAGVALGPANAAVLRALGMGPAKTDIQRGQPLLAIQNRDAFFNRQPFERRTVWAFQFVVVEDEVVPTKLVGVVPLNAPMRSELIG